MDDVVEAQVLSEVRMRWGIPAAELPDEVVKGTFAYQWALLAEQVRELGRSIRAELPRPLRRLLDRPED